MRINSSKTKNLVCDYEPIFNTNIYLGNHLIFPKFLTIPSFKYLGNLINADEKVRRKLSK